MAGLAWALAAGPTAARDFQSTTAALLGPREGAVVVADPTSGRLLALVNPAMANSAHPPGSVFKLVTALAALEAGLAAPSRTMRCDGLYRPIGPVTAGFVPRCWRPGGHGDLTLEEALAASCNVAMMAWGERAGAESLHATARRAGLGIPPGRLPGPHDRRSLVPMAMGEGPRLAVTPMQLAGLTAAIATGTAPRLPAWRPEPLKGAPLAHAATLQRLRTGMRASVTTGSSRQAAPAALSVAGKTGTASYTDGTNRTYGWFTGYAPADRPRVVVVVFLKQANGFADAAPLAKRVLAAWHQAERP
jgi:cell division protein FtsI/penicillin-binding protein 2